MGKIIFYTKLAKLAMIKINNRKYRTPIVDHCIAFSQLPITHYQPQQI
ncbi:MAG: hypothetical protein ACK6A9_21175 [Dolichospermum sp.]|nr:hypothetical protein [Dolichospermum circinale]MCE2719189.1 hypothetical protein [Anabaena sp. 49628_E55]MDB9462354.1 hypothetical protein [Dolichospermum circinale CS-541/04]MDB9477876.1 hypothetical protein [Dolichospermum circinale CS-537/03]MDB9546485.1 hypothetical protein [Dolichospermum circinale CS-1031]